MADAYVNIAPASHSERKVPVICSLGTILVDVRRFWILPVILALVFVVNVMIVGVLPNNDAWTKKVVWIYHALVGLIAVLTGLANASDDRDRRTLWFLRALPVSPLKLVLHKLISSLLLVALFIGLAEAVTWIWKETHLVEELLLFPTLGSFATPTPWNFGGWMPLTFVHICALILIGLASGSVFRNFVVAAVFGLGVYVAWQFIWHAALGKLELAANLRPFYLANTGHFFLLCLLAVCEYVRAVRYMETSEDLGESARSPMQSQPRLNVLRTFRSLRLPWERFVSPHAFGVVLAAMLIAVVNLLLQFVNLLLQLTWPRIETRPDLSSIQLTILALILMPVIGAFAFTREEFSALEGLVYTQPVSRGKILRNRLATVTGWTLVAVTPAAFGSFQFPYVYFIIPVIALALGGAYLGMLGRLFYRNPMLALVMSIMTVSLWTWCIMAMFNFDRLQGSINFPFAAGYLAWYSIVVVLLPLIALTVSYVFSDLLTAHEGARAGAGISIYLSILMLGMLLQTALPGELGWLIVYGVRQIFGMAWGE